MKKEKTKEKKINILKEMFSVKEVAIIVLITCIITVSFSLLVFYISPKSEVSNENEAIREIKEEFEYIKTNFFQNIEDDALINGAIKGMMEALGDDYSEVIDDSDFDTYNIILEGEYYGIGVQIANTETGTILITAVFDDTPASRGGLEVGDVITKIDNESLVGKTAKELGDMIKSVKNKTYLFTITRNNEEKEYSITTEKVVLDSISYKVMESEKKIGYIYISVFANNTDEQFESALQFLEEQNIEGLIIDVRDNAGGHLLTLTNILSQIVDKSYVIYQTKDKDDNITMTYSSGKITKEYPIVVIGNNNSASASELLISALMETKGAKFVGETTFGKGSVQELKTLSTGEQYKMTTKKWLTSKGVFIDKIGITPDYIVTLTEEYYNNPSDETDNQLIKAKELFLGM